MTLTDDEQADLRILLSRFSIYAVTVDELLAHVTELCDSYRAQGYVMGDLAHDGTLRAQGEAEADEPFGTLGRLRCYCVSGPHGGYTCEGCQ